MATMRAIREEEVVMVKVMLKHIGVDESQYPIANQVSEYGDPFMGSINFDNDRPDLYDGDLVQCEFSDDDGENVVLSLTKDKEGRLLDLDFWKANFTPLVSYPTPDKVSYKEK